MDFLLYSLSLSLSLAMCVCVCVCIYIYMCVCVCVCVCECVRARIFLRDTEIETDRHTEREWKREWPSDIATSCVCVHFLEREREREWKRKGLSDIATSCLFLRLYSDCSITLFAGCMLITYNVCRVTCFLAKVFLRWLIGGVEGSGCRRRGLQRAGIKIGCVHVPRINQKYLPNVVYMRGRNRLSASEPFRQRF